MTKEAEWRERVFGDEVVFPADYGVLGDSLRSGLSARYLTVVLYLHTKHMYLHIHQPNYTRM